MIKTGMVSSYDKEKRLARIYFADTETVSAELPILESCPLPLRVDDYVVCAYTMAGDGIILGRLYDKAEEELIE